MKRSTKGPFAVFFLIMLSTSLLSLAAEEFKFQYQVGDSYRLLSEVQQEVWINGTYIHTANMLNKISVHIDSVEGQKSKQSVQYISSVQRINTQGVYQQSTTYDVQFWRSTTGEMTIPAGTWIPPVRNVPVFPNRALQVGDTWMAPATEVHDLRSIGINQPFEFSMKVNYEFVGIVERNGQKLAQINAEYNIFQRYPRSNLRTIHPVQVSGYSNQKIYWDLAKGRPDSAEEEHMIVLTMSDNSNQTFQGNATTRILDSPLQDSRKLRDTIDEQLDRVDMGHVEVREDPEGVVINLDDIQFEADTAKLLAGEDLKLAKIAAILKSLPGFDILVSGHTALSGTESARQLLSEERAKVVGQYLLDAGVRKADQIMFKGYGATKPRADNSTPQGMQQNRRVEITILKN